MNKHKTIVDCIKEEFVNCFIEAFGNALIIEAVKPQLNKLLEALEELEEKELEEIK